VLLALTLVLSLALAGGLLAACGSGTAADNASGSGDGGNSAANDSQPASGQPSKENPVTLRIGAAQVPHAEILESIKPALAEKGVNIEIIVPTDESSLNQLTDNGEIDVNYFQHKPYLDSVVAEKGFDLVSVAGIHIEPIGAYSDRYSSKEQLPDGATVAIPNDGTNEYRALRILEEAGLITLKDGIDPVTTTKDDIASYVKPLEIVELEAGLIVRTHDEYDLYISNTNRIIEGGLDPNTNLFREGADSPYANIVVTRTDRAKDPAVLILVDGLKTAAVKKFIEDSYKGAVVAAF
jgi:D-methionine transport system substrate-binding protein